MSPLLYLAAAVACGLGATCRHLLSTLRYRRALPWPTLLANALGSLALGAVASIAVTSTHADVLMLVVGGGFAGGFTTFSTLAVDAVVLWRDDRRAHAAGYLVASFLRRACCAPPLAGPSHRPHEVSPTARPSDHHAGNAGLLRATICALSGWGERRVFTAAGEWMTGPPEAHGQRSQTHIYAANPKKTSYQGKSLGKRSFCSSGDRI